MIGAQGAPSVTFRIDSSAAFQALRAGHVFQPVRVADEPFRVGALPVDIAIDAIQPADDSAPAAAPAAAAPAGAPKAKTGSQPKALSSVKFQDEKKYHYGIGVRDSRKDLR